MLRNVAPVIEQAADDDGEVDPAKAVLVLAEAVAGALNDLRDELAILNRFDAIERLAFREVAHDPETYVEHEHDGLLSVLMLTMSVASEFGDVSPTDPKECTPGRVEALHTNASRALQLALLLDAFQRSDAGGNDAARLALAREVNWGPPAWPEDQQALLDELFSGVGDRVLRSTTGFGASDLFAVTKAMNQAAEYLTIAIIIEPKPFTMLRAGLYDLADIAPEVVDSVVDWFSTPLGQPRVTDALQAARERRLKPLLVDGDLVCWGTPDQLAWAVQLSFEELLKGKKDFNPYQRHRAAVVERRAVDALSEVLAPEMVVRGGNYRGRHGDGEVDGLLVVDRVAVVVEAKGQMLTTRARRGDPTRLEHNLGEILGTASEQIGRFIRTLRDDGRVTFGAQGVTLESCSIDRVFGVIVTLDELNSLAVASRELAELGVEIDRDASPVVLSLHGLTEVCRLLDNPWRILHYLHRRRETAKRVELWAPEELDVVMFHIRRNLFFDFEPEGTVVEIGVETDPYDAWSYFRRGLRSRPAKKPAQKVPLHLNRLLDGLARERPQGWTHVALHLLDFSLSGRSNVNKMIRETRSRLRTDGSRHDFTIATKTPSWHGLSVVLTPEGDDDGVDRAYFLTHLNGLRHNPTHWLGVTVEVAGERMRPTSVLRATPPFAQVVPADKVRRSVAWDGPRRVLAKGSNRVSDGNQSAGGDG